MLNHQLMNIFVGDSMNYKVLCSREQIANPCIVADVDLLTTFIKKRFEESPESITILDPSPICPREFEIKSTFDYYFILKCPEKQMWKISSLYGNELNYSFDAMNNDLYGVEDEIN